MFTKKKKNLPPQRTLDGVILSKSSLLTNQTNQINQTKKEKKEIFLSSFFSFVPKRKKTLFSSFLILSLFFSLGFFFFSHNEKIKGATYGWIQSSWIGGITTNTANHTDNQENWTEFASKDPNIQVDENGVTITGTGESWVETSDGDFTTGTNTKLYVSGTGTSADIKLLKPIGAICSTNAECFDGNGAGGYGQGFCNAGFCTNPWISGPCSGIGVFKNDAPGTYQWKTTNTDCDTPQCGLNGGQTGDNLVADNSVDFSLYPARNVCKNIGGRLPTLSELQCIYTNRAVYDDYGAFVANYYWSSTENSTTHAYNVYFFSGNTNYGTKTTSFYVRCVRGQ